MIPLGGGGGVATPGGGGGVVPDGTDGSAEGAAEGAADGSADGSADGVGTTIAAQQQSCCINVEHGVVVWEFEGPHA